MRYNSRVKNCHSLDKKCLTSKFVYQADVTSNLSNENKYYLGIRETTFKERCGNYILF